MCKRWKAKMFRLLLLIWLFVLTSADFLMDLKIIKACNESAPISLETMNTVLIHQKLEDQNSNNFKCFLHCLFAKYGWMDEDGGFMIHEIKTGLDEAQLEFSALEYVLYKCTATSSVDKCERSFAFTECFWDRILPKNRNENVKDEFLYRVGDKK